MKSPAQDSLNSEDEKNAKDSPETRNSIDSGTEEKTERIDKEESKPEEKRLVLSQEKEKLPNSNSQKHSLSFSQFLLSQILILILGLAFLGGLYYILNPDSFKKIDKYGGPVTTAPISLYLEVNNPEDDSLVFDQSIIVSGKTTANATVVLSSSDFDLAMEANSFGEFSKVFPLSIGVNSIQITVFDSAGNSKSTVRNVYYSEEKI